MKSKEQIERVKEFFAVYPNENTCILFPDGQIFTQKNIGYAKDFERQSGLQSEIVTRQQVEVTKPADSNSSTVESKLSDLKNKELVALGATLGLTLAINSKKAELIAAIEEAQKNAAADSTEPKTDKDSDEDPEDYSPVNTDK